MITRIKTAIKKQLADQNEILRLSRENEWAHIYHDSIRGKKWLEEMPLNVGRWAGNYTFFYLLNRILNDYKPHSIVEMGLGESTKFIMAYLNNELTNTNHIVIEQDENWRNTFETLNGISPNTTIKIHNLQKVEIKNLPSNAYTNLAATISQPFDLYIVDGPFGSKNYSRYDIVLLAEKFSNGHEFIIIIDDYQRLGEKETAKDLISVLHQKNIKIFTEVYKGYKEVCVIATEKYKYSTSL
ncbi:hypothetical protein GV828_06410 [Flavobacterium sp. NST-5]|uniref:Methyltransferase n=1 Tax=Flavobacterium ichthyis TaxID=2698827 RepID=A0ABW9Z7Z9_9FLAO|nr:hypothetical protein [Flavobacterium ichthyis]NBL64831.1 hypothetical protein [Flavobacterium ichthyis]